MRRIRSSLVSVGLDQPSGKILGSSGGYARPPRPFPLARLLRASARRRLLFHVSGGLTPAAPGVTGVAAGAVGAPAGVAVAPRGFPAARARREDIVSVPLLVELNVRRVGVPEVRVLSLAPVVVLEQAVRPKGSQPGKGPAQDEGEVIVDEHVESGILNRGGAILVPGRKDGDLLRRAWGNRACGPERMGLVRKGGRPRPVIPVRRV